MIAIRTARSLSGHDIRELTQRHEQLKLVTMAMWTLLKEHCGLTESDLRKYIEQVDMMDGKLDGRINTKEQCKCSGCQRTLLTTALACPLRHHTQEKEPVCQLLVAPLELLLMSKMKTFLGLAIFASKTMINFHT